MYIYKCVCMSFIVFLRKAKYFQPGIANCLQHLWEPDKTSAMVLSPLYQFNFVQKLTLRFMRCLAQRYTAARIRTRIRIKVSWHKHSSETRANMRLARATSTQDSQSSSLKNLSQRPSLRDAQVACVQRICGLMGPSTGMNLTGQCWWAKILWYSIHLHQTFSTTSNFPLQKFKHFMYLFSN